MLEGKMTNKEVRCYHANKTSLLTTSTLAYTHIHIGIPVRSVSC